MEIAKTLYQQLDQAEAVSTLPKSVDEAVVNQLCMDLVSQQGF
jgi:hypothetical protein